MNSTYFERSSTLGAYWFILEPALWYSVFRATV
jgi:hypothetical protein